MRYNPPGPGSRRELEACLDSLARKIILRNERICFTCGSSNGLDWGHLFERRHRGTRWDISPSGGNHAQCNLCNAAHEATPGIYEQKYIDKFGEEKFVALRERAHSKHKFTYLELEEMIREREECLNAIVGRSAAPSAEAST